MSYLSFLSRRKNLELERKTSVEIEIIPRDNITISKSDSFDRIREKINERKLKKSALEEYHEIIVDIEKKIPIDYVNLAYQLSQYLRIANRCGEDIDNYYYERFLVVKAKADQFYANLERAYYDDEIKKIILEYKRKNSM